MVEVVMVGQKEKKTQERLIQLFQDELDYTYLGNWETRTHNSNVEEEILTKFLEENLYTDHQIKRTMHEITKVIGDKKRNLYDTNKEFYELLKYGVPIKEAGKNTEQIKLINWDEPLKNHFYVAEEVTIMGDNTKRPDIVLYVNGIALGVVELKRSKISVTEGIRQNLDNQKTQFIKHFFFTQQLVMAGNDTEGLRYGTIETPERYYLKWKEESKVKNLLDKDILLLCNKEKFLELIRDFIVYDKGIKKLCRHNQYFGTKKAQEYLLRREGGIIWHTQGSGKSLTMVWLAKWINREIPNSRVLVITDREELDKQIKDVFYNVGEKDIHRTKSGRDLINTLNKANPWLICSLVHKFKGKSESDDVEDYIKELKSSMPKNFSPKGDIYIYVDECHRTQSGKLHEAMKEILPNSIFIGFTGTPLMKKDKAKSIEVFGEYIDTYKFDEAVEDGVILDLRYEARDIDQRITEKDKIDQWFEIQTAGLTNVAKSQLKKKWGTMQKVLSSKDRLKRVVNDILWDFGTKARLKNETGNAILVSGSIYEACKYYELFRETPLKKCAIITSYDEGACSIKGETIGDDKDTDNVYKNKIYNQMIEHYTELYPEIKTKENGFETVIKDKFVNQPAQMKLLIVVDKLLTGFDAPPATYLYIDKSMQDHGLFQAICRVNRLDPVNEDKEYGYIVDYKDLFKSLEKSIIDYTSGAFDAYDKSDVLGLLKDRIQDAKEKLDERLEIIRTLCEGVKPPKGMDEYRHYFCGESNSAEELKATEQKRVQLYKSTSALVRAYVVIANEMKQAGYTDKEIAQIKDDVSHYTNVRDEVKIASGDYIDLKKYEPDMRYLIDAYIDADASKKISSFDDLTLLEMIVKNGIGKTEDTLKKGGRKENSVAETIENNLRRYIIDKQNLNPKYYEELSKLLDELVKERKDKAISYKNYLKKVEELVRNADNPATSKGYPTSLNTNGKRVLYENLGKYEKLAVDLDEEINRVKKDGWRGHKIKERIIRNAIKKYIDDEDEVEKTFNLVKNQPDY